MPVLTTHKDQEIQEQPQQQTTTIKPAEHQRQHVNKYADKPKYIGKTTPGNQPTLDLNALDKKIYSPQEINVFKLNEAIEKHPLAKRPTGTRSKLAYKELITNLKPTTKYLLPGQLCHFTYDCPRYAEELEYYDRTPVVLFFGITRTKDGKIREIGLNLHYFPPFTRLNVLNTTYKMFKSFFEQNFNSPQHKPNMFISYRVLNHILKRNSKIAFATKMYIPVLRRNTYVIPTRLLPTAFYTEGNFSKATRIKVMQFWRQFVQK